MNKKFEYLNKHLKLYMRDKKNIEFCFSILTSYKNKYHRRTK